MKVLVVEPLGAGGMIHYAYQLCTALSAAGASVTLVTTEDYELARLPHNFDVEKRMRLWPLFDPRSTTVPRNALEVSWRRVRWQARRVVRAARLIAEWERLTGYLLEKRPDVVQFGIMNFPFKTFYLQRLKRRGLLLTEICHEYEWRDRSYGPMAPVIKRMYRTLWDSFAVIFFHEEVNRSRFLKLFREFPGECAHVITHGNEQLFLQLERHESDADVRSHYGFGAGDPVVLFFGVLQPSKGIPDLLRAFAAVRRRCAAARLLIAGFPSKHVDVRNLQEIARKYGIAEAVTFDMRYIPPAEVGPIMRLARVAVYPYRTATQSASLQVAYAFGRPVVATTAGALADAVDDGRSGLLVPPNSPEKLAAAILEFIEDPGRAQTMGDYARRLSETRFSWQFAAETILSVYARLLAGQSRREAAS